MALLEVINRKVIQDLENLPALNTQYDFKKNEIHQGYFIVGAHSLGLPLITHCKNPTHTDKEVICDNFVNVGQSGSALLALKLDAFGDLQEMSLVGVLTHNGGSRVVNTLEYGRVPMYLRQSKTSPITFK